MCDPSVMPMPTHTRLPLFPMLPPRLCAAVGIYSIKGASSGVRLSFGACRGERRQRLQVRADGDQRWERREVGLEAARVVHLRDQADVRDRDSVSPAMTFARRELTRLCFESMESIADPMAIP